MRLLLSFFLLHVSFNFLSFFFFFFFNDTATTEIYTLSLHDALPIFRGAYPADLLERNEIVAPFLRDGDFDVISAPLDFLGVNNYFRFVVSAGSEGPRIEGNVEAQHTDMGWEVYPDGLHQLLVRVACDYAPPAIYVTENGAAFGDVRVHDGRVHDPERTAYLESYIAAVSRAIADGAPVNGYFVWR